MSGDPNDGPQVSFGAYVKPDTVQEAPERPAIALPFVSPPATSEPVAPQPAAPQPAAQAAPAPQRRMDPAIVAMGLLAVTAFLLGIMVTLYLSKGRAVEMTSLPLEQAAPATDTTAAAPARSDMLAAVVNASLEDGVTRNAPSDLITPTGAMSYPQPNDLSLQEILLGLNPERGQIDAKKQNILGRDKLQMLRESVLAGKYTVKTITRHGKERLCLRVPKNNVTQDEAADLIRQAAERGEIELPASLSTSDGSFDADTLIFNLVQTSLANDGTEQGKRAAEEMRQRAFAASEAKTKKVKGERTYVVERGDSLAYISLQFYGQPSEYLKIFEANRKLLNSPDRIQIGQRLIIPG